MAVTCGNGTGVCVMEMVTRVAQMKFGAQEDASAAR